MTQNKELREVWLPLLHMAHIGGRPVYEVSNTGKVRKFSKNGYVQIKAYPNPEGYLTVWVKNGNGQYRKYYLHRLVGVTFIPNPEGHDTLDHIDADKSNNCTRNLRWCSREENITYGHKSGVIRRTFPKHPVKIEKGNFYKCFHTFSEAAEYIGCSIHAVQAATRGHYRPKGYMVTSLIPKEVNGNLFSPDDFE